MISDGSTEMLFFALASKGRHAAHLSFGTLCRTQRTLCQYSTIVNELAKHARSVTLSLRLRASKEAAPVHSRYGSFKLSQSRAHLSASKRTKTILTNHPRLPPEIVQVPQILVQGPPRSASNKGFIFIKGTLRSISASEAHYFPDYFTIRRYCLSPTWTPVLFGSGFLRNRWICPARIPIFVGEARAYQLEVEVHC